MCRTCIPALLVHEHQISGHTASVLHWLTQQLGDHSLHSVPVTLDDGQDFVHQQMGQTDWVFNGATLGVTIRILRGVTSNTFSGTLAHEYGHVLLVSDPATLRFLGGFPQDRHVEEEGFCEVIKYLWIQENGGSSREFDLRDMRNNPDPVYGGGFRLMWPRYERAGSINALRDELIGLSPSPARRNSLRRLFRPKEPADRSPIEKEKPVPSADVPAPNQPGPTEGGSHRPTRDITLKNRHNQPEAAGTPDAPRPSVTVNFTRRDSASEQTSAPSPDERPTRTIKRPPRH